MLCALICCSPELFSTPVQFSAGGNLRSIDVSRAKFLALFAGGLLNGAHSSDGLKTAMASDPCLTKSYRVSYQLCNLKWRANCDLGYCPSTPKEVGTRT